MHPAQLSFYIIIFLQFHSYCASSGGAEVYCVGTNSGFLVAKNFCLANHFLPHNWKLKAMQNLLLQKWNDFSVAEQANRPLTEKVVPMRARKGPKQHSQVPRRAGKNAKPCPHCVSFFVHFGPLSMLKCDTMMVFVCLQSSVSSPHPQRVPRRLVFFRRLRRWLHGQQIY